MEQQNNPSVEYVIVYPKNKNRIRYYVNNNLRDSHSMNKDDLYKWLCEYITPPTTAQVAEYLQTYQPFIVDTKNNYVFKLEPRNSDIAEEEKRRARTIDFEIVYQKAQTLYEEALSTGTDPLTKGSITGSTKKEKIPNDNKLQQIIDKNL